MLGKLLYTLTFLVSEASMSNTLDEVDEMLEKENLKNPNKDNGHKYVLPLVPSLIPVANIVFASLVRKNKYKIYKEMKDIRCRFIVADTPLEDTYNKLRGSKVAEMQKDLGNFSHLMVDKKDDVVNKLQDKYTGIVFYEYNKATNKLEEYIDDSLDELPKQKKLVP